MLRSYEASYAPGPTGAETDRYQYLGSHPGKRHPVLPRASACFDGGASQGSTDRNAVQLFEQAVQPAAPMTVVARIRTVAGASGGRAQAFLGWRPLSDQDSGDWAVGGNASSAFLLDKGGNLEFRLHDGQQFWSLAADPRIDLADGFWHTVAIVREGEEVSIGVASLYADGRQVGEGFLEGIATQLQPWALSRNTWKLGREEGFRGFVGDVTGVRIYQQALPSYWIRQLRNSSRCTLAPLPGRALHSNLGGLGPDRGERALRFYNVTSFLGQPLDLVVRNATGYSARYPERNGLASKGVGRINIAANSPVEFTFRMTLSGTNRTVGLEAMSLAFFHFEQGASSGSLLFLSPSSRVDSHYLAKVDSEVMVSGSDTDQSLTFSSRERPPSDRHGLGDAQETSALYPDEPESLTRAQEKTSFGVLIKQTSGFNATFGLIGKEGHARDIFFGGDTSFFNTGAWSVVV